MWLCEELEDKREKERRYKATVGFECVNKKIMQLKLKFACVKLFVVVVDGPCNDRGVNEKGRFWNELG